MARSIAARMPRPPALRVPLPAFRPGALRTGALATGRLRLAAIAVAIAACVAGGAWMLARHTSISAVSEVSVRGVSGPQAGAIEAALAGAAHGMSTLGVSTASLRAAAAPFPLVAGIAAHPSFPHRLLITVTERVAVAALASGGASSAVAADGTVLGPALLAGSLPTIAVPELPAVGRSVRGGELLGELAILGAAPEALRARVASVAQGRRGIALTMRNGLVAYFGDDSSAHAKWLALAAVLSDPASAGAGYVDVRVPSRAAAGFAAGSGPAAGAEPGSQPAGAGTESTVAALAAGLSSGTAAGSASTAPAAGAQEPAAGATAGGQEAASTGSAGAQEAPAAAATEGSEAAGTGGAEGG